MSRRAKEQGDNAMKNPLIVAAALGLLVGALVAVVLTMSPPASNPSVIATTGKALVGGPFSLVDASGKRVTEKDFAGRPMLVYFGFTNCPDICPSGLQVISAALDKLGTSTNIAPLFITLDPERDTPQVMGEYVKSFHPAIVGLTGTPEEVAAAAKAYRVYFRKVEDQKTRGAYSVDHSGFMYLMNGKGEYVRHFPHSVGIDELATALAGQQ